MSRPFELKSQELAERLEEMVNVTVMDLTSEFLLMPTGPAFIKYPDFRAAFEVLKRNTRGFFEFTEEQIFSALLEDSRSLCVLRSILGMTPPEWAELVRSEFAVDIPQGAARVLDRKCREDIGYIKRIEGRFRNQIAKTGSTRLVERPVTLKRVDTLIRAAIHFISQGAPVEENGFIHRMPNSIPPREPNLFGTAQKKTFRMPCCSMNVIWGGRLLLIETLFPSWLEKSSKMRSKTFSGSGV